MRIYSSPLTDQDVRNAMVSKLEAVITVSLADAIDAEGINQFDDIINGYFPSVTLSNVSYEIVGFTPHKGDASVVARGDLHIKVRADIE